MLSRLGLAVALVLSVTRAGGAQEISGALEGRVHSPDGAPLAGVQVTASGPSLQRERTAVTDQRGYFRLLGLAVGEYSVRVRRIGHRPVRYENVLVRLGRTASLGEIRLEPEAVELPEMVVSPDRALIDLTSTTLGVTLQGEEFQRLPVDRSYHSIIALVPQANRSYLGDDTNVGGATGQENAYYIDGINVTDPYKGVGGTNLPYNFVKQIDVRTGGYEAEYGRAVGGVVNVITYSGGNEFRASIFGFFTHSALASEAKRGAVDLRSGGFSRYDAGVSLGGPIQRDRLWFFAAYDQSIASEDIRFPGLGVRADRTVAHLLAAKLTWQATPGTSVIVTAVGDPATQDRIGYNSPGLFQPAGIANPDPFLGAWRRGGVSLSVAGRQSAGEHVLLEALLSHSRRHLIGEPATDRGRQEPLFVDVTTGIWSGGYGGSFDHHTVRTSASVTGTYLLGNHTFKAGLQSEHILFDEDWTLRSDGNLAGGAGEVIRFAPGSYGAVRWEYLAKDRARMPAAFAQASVQLHSRFRLNAGLRWEQQSFRIDTTGGRLGNQWQPRVGFVYQFGEAGSQRLVGSYGRFYQQLAFFAPSANSSSGWKVDFLGYDHDPRVDPSGGEHLCCPSGLPFPRALRAEHHDEVSIGYERELAPRLKAGLRGVHRWLKEALVHVSRDTITGYVGLANPGRGLAISFPRPIRRYTALELTVERSQTRGLNLLASYVLSRNYGNYSGVYNALVHQDNANGGVQWNTPTQLANATGLLPNDRTHVVKVSGSKELGVGLTVGTFFVWETGTPLSELGGDPLSPFSYTFLRPRGAGGRTPAIWDWNLRFAYDLQRLTGTSVGQRVVLDLLHLFSQRQPVDIDQRHYSAVDSAGNQIGPNPHYGQPVLYQPPMSARLGLSVDF